MIRSSCFMYLGTGKIMIYRFSEKVFEMLGMKFKEEGDGNSWYYGISDDKVGVVSKILRPDGEGNKDNLLAFLMVDSMFCLLNVAGILQSNVKTTLFSNSFCYGVYDRLYYWAKWSGRIPEKSQLYPAFKDLKNKILEGYHELLMTPEYMLGMARRHVEAAYSMHSEGAEYQSFIRDLFILDDDLQNNTCQFYFALERMKINSDFFDSEPSLRAEENFLNCFSPDLFYQNKVDKINC